MTCSLSVTYAQYLYHWGFEAQWLALSCSRASDFPFSPETEAEFGI